MVIDASVWISFLVRQDVHHATTHAWFSGVVTAGTPTVAPILLLSEIGGAMARRLGSPALAEKAINQLMTVPTLRLVSIDHELGIQSAMIAARLRLRGADSLYVAVAARLSLPLVSWDRAHAERASELITVYSPGQER